MRVGKCVIGGAVLLAGWGRSSAVRAETLTSAQTRAVISDKSGQVMALDEGKRSVLASNTDRYDFAGKTSDESNDRVIARRREKGVLVLECSNASLGLKISKRYRLHAGLLEKEAIYTAADGGRRLLRVSSQSLLAPAFFQGGSFYTPTDDGYKVRAIPLLAGAAVKEPLPWLISTGQFVYSQPRLNAVFTHYRYRINGDYIYGEADRSIESQFIPGGAITALGEDFVDTKSRFRLQSRFAVLKGDPRAYHRHIVSQPPYSDYRKSPVPKWFPGARMYFGDGMLGTGRGLIEDRESVAADLKSFLKIVPGNGAVMVFFNHWSTSGDYPYRGTLRYLTYTSAGWSAPVPVEKLKENIRWLKSLSPRIKVGGYFFIAPAEGTYPVTRHPEWFIYNKDLKIEAGGDGIGWCGIPDMSSGYRPYLLDQMQHAVTDLGFDWVHFDGGASENVNWKTKKVVQTAEWAKFFNALARYYDPREKAIVQNVASSIGLWADGSYDECQQPDRWENTDWRILAVPDFLSGLYRTQRPHTWQNLVYGTSGAYGWHNAFAGMRGWIRNASSWWRWVPQGLAYEQIVDEMLATRETGIALNPAWWRGETQTLEAEVWRRGAALIVPMFRHAEVPGLETIKFNPPSNLDPAALRPHQLLFGFDYLLPPPAPTDAFAPVPEQMHLTRLLGLEVSTYKSSYSHRLQMPARRNEYHVVTPVPGWVYSVNGKRRPFLLPETQGVKIEGRLFPGAARYSLTITANAPAEIVAYCPAQWKGASVKIGGRAIPSSVLTLAGRKALRFKVPQGRLQVVVGPAAANPKSTSYPNPQVPVWTVAAERLFYTNLSHRAYHENDVAVLELREAQKGAGGLVDFRMVQPEKAGGFSLRLKGTGSGGTLLVQQFAGDVWTYRIKDDFRGWQRFAITRDQMQTASSTRRWEPTTALHLTVQPAAGQSMTVGDVHLLAARPGDIVEAEKVKRRLTIPLVSEAPVVDGRPGDAAWAKAPVADRFLQMGGGGKLSPSVTKVRACYDAENLYVLFENSESIEEAGKVQSRDTAIWNTDHVELFLQPDRRTSTWFHLLVDPAGTIEDLKWSAVGKDEGGNGNFEVRTSLNWKAGWVAEFKVPFNMTGVAPPHDGASWGINFARKDNGNEWSNWAADGEWLDPAAFGEAIFSREASP